jgi:hypothetical protein
LFATQKFKGLHRVKANRIVATHRPAQGRVTFAHARAMQPGSACGTAMQASFALGNLPLDLHEDRVHPGEGSA